MPDLTPIQAAWIVITASNGQAVVTLRLDDSFGTVVSVKVQSVGDAAELGRLVAERRCRFDTESGKLVSLFKPPGSPGENVGFMSESDEPPAPRPRPTKSRRRRRK